MTHEALRETLGAEFLWLIEYLEERGWPQVVIVSELVEASKNRHRQHISFMHQIPTAMPKFGYEKYRSPMADGRWRIHKKREILYKKIGSDGREVLNLFRNKSS